MIIDYVTTSGAVYRTDGSFMKKFSSDRDGSLSMPKESLWGLMGVPQDYVGNIHKAPEKDVEVGDHLYVRTRNYWWLSTPIVEITEVEAWDSPAS